MGKRFCWKCQRKHGKPTGMKCKKTIQSNVLPVDDAGSKSQLGDGQTQNGSDISMDNVPPEDLNNKPKSHESVEKRLDSLETLLYKLTENIWPQQDTPQTPTASRPRSESRSSVGSTPDNRRHKRHFQSPSRYNYAYDTLFEDEDINISSFEHVMIATFRTMQDLSEENKDLSGLINLTVYLWPRRPPLVYT